MTRPLIAFVFLCLGGAHAAAQTPTQSPAPPVVKECLRLKALKIDWGDRENADKHRKLWLETCRQAYATNGDDPHIKVALADAMTERTEFIPLLRAAIAQDDTEAMLLLFNDHNSFDGHPGRPDLIPRAEAEKALRRAAELGNADAIFRLATILTRGGPIKPRHGWRALLGREGAGKSTQGNAASRCRRRGRPLVVRVRQGR